MDLKDIFWLSYKDLSEKRVRTALTIGMVVIGIAAIIALTSVTAGISQSINSQLAALGPTSIIVSSTGSTGFTVADSSQIASLPNVTSVTPVLTGSGYLYAGNQNTSVTIIGTTAQGLAQLLGGNLTFYQGTIYQDTITPSVVLGHSVAFPTSAAGLQTATIGQSATLRTEGRDAETLSVPIIGILPSHGGLIIPVDTSAFMSLSAAEVVLHRSSFNDMLVVAKNSSSVNATANLITTVYGSSARVVTTASIISTASSITGSLTLLFGAIAGVSLLVAAIGIMNIMLIAVYERTHEIGIMKSVGFKNNHILMIFLLQALIIGFVGGVIGIILGAGGSYGFASLLKGVGSGSGGSGGNTHAQAGPGANGGGVYVSGGGRSGPPASSSSSPQSSSSGISFSPVFPISTIISAILIAMVVSALAGIYPAWRASKMEPIDALRTL